VVGAAAGNRLYGGIGMWTGEAAGAGIFALLALAMGVLSKTLMAILRPRCRAYPPPERVHLIIARTNKPFHRHRKAAPRAACCKHDTDNRMPCRTAGGCSGAGVLCLKFSQDRRPHPTI
jgi:hypothetical protein